MAENFLATGEESLKNLERRLGERPVEVSAATRESILGNASELSIHIADMISDTVRGAVIDGIQAGEGINQIARRIRNSKGLEDERRDPGGGGTHRRRRDFRNISETIARTETRRVFTQVAKDGMRETGIDKVRWLAISDDRVDPECVEAATGGEKGDGIYPLDEIPRGGPPLHHNCRCVLQPVIPGEE